MEHFNSHKPVLPTFSLQFPLPKIRDAGTGGSKDSHPSCPSGKGQECPFCQMILSKKIILGNNVMCTPDNEVL